MTAALTRLLIVFCVFLSSAVFAPVQAKPESTLPLYKLTPKSSPALKTIDESIMNNLTAARYYLMAGEKLHAISRIKMVMGKVDDKKGGRRYKAAHLFLLRIKEGRSPVYLFFPPSYETLMNRNDELAYPPLELFRNVKRVELLATIDIDYAKIHSSVARAFAYAMKGRLEKADEELQEIYADLIDDVISSTHPIEVAKGQVREASQLLKQGKVGKAVALINESEVLLKAHAKDNPDVSYMNKLRTIFKGYDKIRTYNYGQPGEVSNVRDKIFFTLSGMKSKLKSITIRYKL